VQALNLKSNLQMGVSTPMFQAVSGSLSWSTLDISPKKLKHRMLMEKAPSSSTNKMFMIGVFAVPIMGLHAILVTTYEKRMGKMVQGILGFPTFQLVLAHFLMNPFVDAAARFFAQGTVGMAFAGIATLCVLPLPLLVYCVYFIRTHIVHKRDIVFANTDVKWYWRIFSRHYGKWYVPNPYAAHMAKAHEIFYIQHAGPFHKIVPVYELDPVTKRYVRYRIEPRHNVMSHVATYFSAYMLAKTILTTLLLGSFPSGGRAYPSQSAALAALSFIHGCAMVVLSPSNTVKEFVSEVVHSLTDVGTYCQSLAVSLAPRLVKYLDNGITTLQMVGLFTKIGFAMAGVLNILVVMWFSFRNRSATKKFSECVAQMRKKHILHKKYANRWLYRVHARTLENWPIPCVVTPKQKEIIVELLP
jgi:hypothetical protein